MKKQGNHITGVVYSVYTIPMDLLHELEIVFSEKYGTEVKLENVLDSSLIEGIRVEIDNLVIDDSIKAKLFSLKEQLLKRGGFGHAID